MVRIGVVSVVVLDSVVTVVLGSVVCSEDRAVVSRLLISAGRAVFRKHRKHT